TARPCQAEGLTDGVGQLLHAAHEVVVLGDGQRDTGDVDLLEAVGADLGGGDVAADGHHGDGINVGRCNTGDQVGGTGAGSTDNHAGLSGGAGVAVGSMGSPLLVGRQDVMDLGLVLVEAVVDVDDLTARV